MTTQVEATFMDGILKPDRPLPLPDRARVRLTIEPIEPWSREKGLAAWEAFKRLIQEQPLHLGGKRYKRDELYDRR